MTLPVMPPEAPIVAPYPALGSPSFNAEAYTYGSGMPAVVSGIQALADNAFDNATAAHERAVSAASSAATANTQSDAAMGYRNTAQSAATTATDKAAEATASALAASKLNLGDKATPPTTDNQGGTLRAGATYYDTTLGKWRVWSGAAWGDGISTVAGVSSLNGQTGDLVKTTLAGYGITDALPSENPAMTGNISASGSVRGNKYAVADLNIDCAQSNYFTKSISSNSTFTFSGIPASGIRYGMIIEIALTGGTITWPAGVIWPDGSAPALTTGKTHLFFMITSDGGTTWRASARTNYVG